VEAGVGEATNRSCHRRLTVAARAIVVGVRVPILSSWKASWQASGLLTTSCRSGTSEIIG
jgi:hypothetical protein